MADSKNSRTSKGKTPTESTEQAPGKLEVRCTKDLSDLENDAELAKELCETSDFLLSGILQNFGRAADDENTATVIAVLATLEKAARIQDEIVRGVAFLHGKLQQAGVDVRRTQEESEVSQ